jgi:hypothetical protein
LLVVIAVIAVLMGILMPALSAVREQGRRAVCSQNEKNTGLGLFLYANDYNGKLPLNEVDRWLFDVSYWTTDIILASGGFDRHIFYCPSWAQRDNIIFWRYGENLPAGTSENYERPEPTAIATRKDYHRIMGYYWLLDTKAGRANPPMSTTESKVWVRSTVEASAKVNGVKVKKPLGSVELITDVTASNGPDRDNADFAGATGGAGRGGRSPTGPTTSRRAPTPRAATSSSWTATRNGGSSTRWNTAGSGSPSATPACGGEAPEGEIRSSKFEIRNKSKTENSNDRNGASLRRRRVGHVFFGPVDLFRISCFGFRICSSLTRVRST